MAVRYFDSVNGNNSNDGLTPATAWATFDAKAPSCVGGDTLLFARGTTQVINTIYRQFPNGSVNSPTYVGAYGFGSAPVFTNPTSIGSMILNSSNASYVTIEDIDFNAASTSGSGNSQTLYISAQGASAANNMIFRRCIFRNCASSGFYVAQETTATAAPNNILVEDCLSYNNGGHGFITTGYNITYNRCVAYNNGLATGAHGFSSYRLREDFTSGWTLVSGNVYSQASARANYYYVRVSSGAQSSVWPQLIKNSSTPTTPNPGEYGYTGGVLYINIGANPAGHTITAAYGLGGYNIKYVDCVAYNNKAYPIYPYHEGHGFAFDDFTSFSTIDRCYSYGNEGAGISFNQGEQNTVKNCVIVSNDYGGIGINAYPYNYVYNNLLYNNGKTLSPAYGEVVLLGRSAYTEIKNNIIYATYCPSGVYSSGTDKTGVVISNNIIYSKDAEVNKWTGSAGSATYSNNLLPYSLFEGTNGIGNSPTGWAQLGAQASAMTLSPQEIVAGVSTKIVQIRKISASGNTEGIQTAATLAAGKTYIFSLYVRVPTAVTASDILLYFAPLGPNAFYLISAANLALLPKDVWIRVAGSFTTTTGSQTNVGIGCQFASAGSGFDFALPQIFEGTRFHFVNGGTETNTFVFNPLLSVSSPSPTVSSAVKNLGIYVGGGKDINQVSYSLPPSIGPWELRR